MVVVCGLSDFRIDCILNTHVEVKPAAANPAYPHNGLAKFQGCLTLLFTLCASASLQFMYVFVSRIHCERSRSQPGGGRKHRHARAEHFEERSLLQTKVLQAEGKGW